MEIVVDEKFIISSDEYNWVLKEKKVSKEGKEYIVTLGYFGNIEQIVNNLLERSLKASEASSIQELITTLESVQKGLTIEINNKANEVLPV
jgi:hypothetical protein